MRRKLFALGLSAAMVLCLASCAGKSAGGSEPKDKLVGTWVCEHDFLAEMKEQAVSASRSWRNISSWMNLLSPFS